MSSWKNTAGIVPLGIGYYTAAEAARLLRIPPRNVRRWLSGYSYRRAGQLVDMPPLWMPQLPANDSHLELGFRDLIELRFVSAFIEEGLALQTIRACLATARELVASEHPFATRRFKTDGRRIFLETIDRLGIDPGDGTSSPKLSRRDVLDLKSRQYVFTNLVDRTFRDLDFDADIVARWRPYNGKATIVVDPTRVFGQPIISASSVPTIALAGAVRAEGNEKRVSYLYEVPLAQVRDAVRFESELAAA
jgi:uncharacterized protein (DUF433 family)